MKAKLIKVEDEIGRFYVLESKENLPENYTLSKENCDEIFGVVDVEKLAFYEFPNGNINGETSIEQKIRQSAFKVGFKKAMELNKDKLFTEDDVNLAFVLGKNNDESRINKLINSRLQPTEIDVEVVTLIDYFDGSNKLYLSTDEAAKYCTDTGIPHTDSEGNLILIKL
jgi:hypothetical protein